MVQKCLSLHLKCVILNLVLYCIQVRLYWTHVIYELHCIFEFISCLLGVYLIYRYTLYQLYLDSYMVKYQSITNGGHPSYDIVFIYCLKIENI